MQFFIRVQSSHLKLFNDKDKIATYLVNNLPSQNDEFINTDLSALSA